MKITIILFAVISGDLIGWNRLKNSLVANQNGIQKLKRQNENLILKMLVKHPEYLKNQQMVKMMKTTIAGENSENEPKIKPRRSTRLQRFIKNSLPLFSDTFLPK